MNSSFNILAFLMLLFVVTSCTDILDQPPKDSVALEEFFSSEKDLKAAVNDLYSILEDEEVYTDDSSTDNIVPSTIASRVKGTRTVPTGKGSGGWAWDNLRKINFIIENYGRVDNKDAREKYSGIARFFRAYFYFRKVKRFGDVPWYGKVLEEDDEDLYKARDPRELVMDSVLVDIDYAISNIPAEKELNRITKYTALILKARIGLYEGTFRKYHKLGDYVKFLEEGASAAKELIDSGAYTLFTDGGKDKAYRELFARDHQDDTETILAAEFSESHRNHGLAFNLVTSTKAWGLPKDLINSYLMTDGSRFTDQADYKTMEYYEEMQDRDPRLTQTTAGPDYTEYNESSKASVDLSIATTGYRIIKALPEPGVQWGANGSWNDIIIFRYAEALLIYAEAKAELGTLTQADLDLTINKLRDRVEMPHLYMADANANPDPYQEALYPNVDQGANKGVILEIRRERRIEMINEGLRWDDLMRWKEGQRIEQPMVGIYFPGLGAYDFTGDGEPDVYVYDRDDSGAPDEVTAKIDINKRPLRNPVTGDTGGAGNLDPFPQRGSFDENRDYYYPLPKEDLRLNKNLKQNPGWENN